VCCRMWSVLVLVLGLGCVWLGLVGIVNPEIGCA